MRRTDPRPESGSAAGYRRSGAPRTSGSWLISRGQQGAVDGRNQVIQNQPASRCQSVIDNDIFTLLPGDRHWLALQAVALIGKVDHALMHRAGRDDDDRLRSLRSEEHTSELQSRP